MESITDRSLGLSTDAALRVSCSSVCGVRVRARVGGRRDARLQVAKMSANIRNRWVKKTKLSAENSSHHSQQSGRCVRS